MIILGLDPGTASVGYAILEAGPRLRLCDAGLLAVKSREPGERLAELHRSLAALIKKWKPAAAAVEKLFFAANAKTAMAVSEARGVLLLTAVLAGTTLYEYNPAAIKKTITGQGNADKTQMRKMVLLTLPETRRLRAQDDVFDAIAAALTCHFRERSKVDQNLIP